MSPVGCTEAALRARDHRPCIMLRLSQLVPAIGSGYLQGRSDSPLSATSLYLAWGTVSLPWGTVSLPWGTVSLPWGTMSLPWGGEPTVGHGEPTWSIAYGPLQAAPEPSALCYSPCCLHPRCGRCLSKELSLQLTAGLMLNARRLIFVQRALVRTVASNIQDRRAPQCQQPRARKGGVRSLPSPQDDRGSLCALRCHVN